MANVAIDSFTQKTVGHDDMAWCAEGTPKPYTRRPKPYTLSLTPYALKPKTVGHDDMAYCVEERGRNIYVYVRYMAFFLRKGGGVGVNLELLQLQLLIEESTLSKCYMCM